MSEKRPRRVLRTIFVLVLLALVAAQFVPVDRSNGKVDPALTLKAPDDVLAVLRRACFDCHSNETVWPWYSYVAPASWLVADHVHEGREALNFSTWLDEYPDEVDQEDARGECWDEVKKGKMPMESYVILHGEAKLSDADKALIRDWAGN
ncbi:MAG: heme-binding domain-containing protein [Planctomycetes bacterium]|nr:heme-binding domain-containing protein [Planctomycetota bacterium]